LKIASAHINKIEKKGFRAQKELGVERNSLKPLAVEVRVTLYMGKWEKRVEGATEILALKCLSTASCELDTEFDGNSLQRHRPSRLVKCNAVDYREAGNHRTKSY
jgi:hypothetical protein